MAAGLTDAFEVRGECVMPQAAFRKLNEEREAAGQAPAAIPATPAAGTIRTLSRTSWRSEGWISMLISSPGRHRETLLPAQSETLKALGKAGLRVNPQVATVASIEGVLEFIARVEPLRDTLGYEIDGIVHQGGSRLSAAPPRLHR